VLGHDRSSPGVLELNFNQGMGRMSLDIVSNSIDLLAKECLQVLIGDDAVHNLTLFSECLSECGAVGFFPVAYTSDPALNLSKD